MLKGILPTIKFISLELSLVIIFVLFVCIVTMNKVSMNNGK